jgi:hypothetical protein
MKIVALRLSAFATALALMSCNGSGADGSGGLVNIQMTTANFTDTSADGTGTGTPWDITQVATSRATNSPTVLFVTVTYTQNVQNALPPPGSMPNASQLGTFIAFVGPAGTFSATACGNTYNNIAYLVDGGGIGNRLADGNYAILSAATMSQVGEATVNAGTNTMLFTIPLGVLSGGSSAPQLFVASVNSGSPTDCDPTAPALLTW